ncbi:MAG TPA: phosphate ABC transporter substrate-binding protein [Cyanobacteria bacterium UBA8803]|nr:phosphate ABC transporter substrate-binding protein [Cyanobacteria bacterium UBA9273]HBL57606.1 phosphate ABC transporter substrate-binding protein [Cyanobacteria bacterium UBA8803]
MSQKNETTVLVLSLLITVGLVGAGIWWLIPKSNPDPKPSSQPQPSHTVENFAQAPNVPEGLFSYGGSTTWAPIRKEVDSAIQTVWPQFRLRYTDPTSGAPGSGTGIKMLLENQLAFAQSSRSIKQEEYQQASQRGFTLKEIPVAIDGIAIAVHPTLNISGLTVAQIKDIYTGKITTWKQVGGPDFPIKPYSRRIKEGGTIEFFVENVLEGGEFGANVEFISTTTQALQEVANNPGSIYYASAPEVVPQCSVRSLPIGRQADRLIPPYQEPFVPLSQCPGQRNQLNAQAFQTGDYPITRRLFVIIKQNGQIDEQAGEAYAGLLLTNQGQKLISNTGFVSIR